MIQNKDKINLFSFLDSQDPQNLRFAKEIVNLPGVEQILLLPDSYTKEKYTKVNYKATIPSSSVILSDVNFFYPQFKSRGINCGMMAVLLPITKEELNEKFIQEIQKKITHSFLYYFFYSLRLPFIRKPKDLNKKDFIKILQGDSEFICKRFNIENHSFSFFQKISFEKLKGDINKKWLKRSIRLRYFFGRYFGGNHFLEIQEVIKIDKQSFYIKNIRKGQIVITFHTGGEALQDVIKKEWREKYIIKKEFVALKDNKIKQSFFGLNNLLMNLGYAYRLATFSLINEALQKVYGKQKQAKIIIDKNHNSFKVEKIDNQEKIVYRHNAENLRPDEIGIISGNYNHNSYIVQGLSSLQKTFFTIDHGIGNILKIKPEDNIETKDKVIQYKFRKGIKWLKEKKEFNIIKNKNVDSFFDFFQKEGIIKPIIELKPIINIKNK